MRIRMRSLLFVLGCIVPLELGGCEFPRETRMEPIDPAAAAAAKDSTDGRRPKAATGDGSGATSPSARK